VDVVLDASQSYDPSGRPLKHVEWTYLAPSDNHTSITNLMAAVNARLNGAR